MHKDINKLGITKISLGSPKIDYLEFSSNSISWNCFEELRRATVTKTSGDRFYKYSYDSENYTLRLGRKNKNLKESMTRVKHGALPYVIELGLPIESTITRVDICIDFATKAEAFALVYGANYSAYIDSRGQKGGGETYYFGERTRQIFERIYYKPEAGGWRYEVEIKPQSKMLPIAQFARLDERIRVKYGRLIKAQRIERHHCYTPNELMTCTVTPERQQEIRFVFSFEYMTVQNRHDFWYSLNSHERDYLDTILRTTDDFESLGNWRFVERLKKYLG